MSQSKVVHEAGGMVTTPPSGDGSSAREAELLPETTAALVSRAKDIIAGRTQPPALVAPPGVEQHLRREFGGGEPPTADALRRITKRLSLEAHYGGRPVACVTTRAGTLAVLASGDREVEALLRGLSDEEGARVVVTDTVPF